MQHSPHLKLSSYRLGVSSKLARIELSVNGRMMSSQTVY